MPRAETVTKALVLAAGAPPERVLAAVEALARAGWGQVCVTVAPAQEADLQRRAAALALPGEAVVCLVLQLEGDDAAQAVLRARECLGEGPCLLALDPAACLAPGAVPAPPRPGAGSEGGLYLLPRGFPERLAETRRRGGDLLAALAETSQ